MEVLFNFMQWVSSFSHIDEESGSKMDVHNLATVMAPNILHLGKRDVPLDDNLLAIEAVHSLIEYNEYMCEVSLGCLSLTLAIVLTLFEGAGRSSSHPQRLHFVLCQRRYHDQGNPEAIWRPYEGTLEYTRRCSSTTTINDAQIS